MLTKFQIQHPLSSLATEFYQVSKSHMVLASLHGNDLGIVKNYQLLKSFSFFEVFSTFHWYCVYRVNHLFYSKIVLLIEEVVLSVINTLQMTPVRWPNEKT